MAFDVKKWLVEEMKFSAEDADTMATKFTGERATTLEKTYGDVAALKTAQSEMVKARKDVDDKDARLTAEMAEWASMTAKEQKAALALQAELEQARVRATQLETRGVALAVQAGIDPKAFLDGTTPLPAKKEEPVVPPVDTSRFITTDQYGPMAAFSLQLPAKLQRMEREHFALTGEHLDTEAITAEILTRAQKKDGNIDPIAIWEEKHDIPKKRTAKADADLKAQLAAEHARGMEEGRTNAALPGPHVPGRHAPVFGPRSTDGQLTARTSVLKRPQPETGVRSAAAALASHKYASKTA